MLLFRSIFPLNSQSERFFLSNGFVCSKISCCQNRDHSVPYKRGVPGKRVLCKMFHQISCWRGGHGATDNPSYRKCVEVLRDFFVPRTSPLIKQSARVKIMTQCKFAYANWFALAEYAMKLDYAPHELTATKSSDRSDSVFVCVALSGWLLKNFSVWNTRFELKA